MGFRPVGLALNKTKSAGLAKLKKSMNYSVEVYYYVLPSSHKRRFV
jgi:hypothetical protein